MNWFIESNVLFPDVRQNYVSQGSALMFKALESSEWRMHGLIVLM